MPQYRKLPTGSLDSLDIAAMPDLCTRLTWLLLPLIMSREGTTLDHPLYLRSKLYPLCQDVTSEMVASAIAWFKEHGLLQAYQVNGHDYLWMPIWDKVQGTSDKEAPSQFPPPPRPSTGAAPAPSSPPTGSAEPPQPPQIQSQGSPERLQTDSRPVYCSVEQCSVDAAADSGIAEQLQTNSAAAAAGKAFQAWQSARGGAVNELDTQIISGLVDEFTAEWVTAAIHEANSARQDRLPSINFIEAILRRWKREGFRQPLNPQVYRAKALAQEEEREDAKRVWRKLKEWNARHGIKATHSA